MVSLRPRYVLLAKMWPRRPSDASMLPSHRNTNRDKAKKKIMFCPFHRNQYLGITQHTLNVFFKQTAKQRSVYICVVNSVELDYSYLHLFQVCPAVYIWRKSIGNGAQTSAEFFQCEGKGSHYMFLFATIHILKYTNFLI